MPKKPTRGKKLDIQFQGPDTDQRWAEDDWDPEDLKKNQEGGAEGEGEGKAKRPGIASVKAAQFGNFRDEERLATNNVVPDDMKPPYTAHVRRLPRTIKDEKIKDLFVDCPGNIIDVRPVRLDNAFFAYVEFDSREGLQAAILLTGKIVGRNPIHIDIATEKKDKGMRRGGSSNMLDRDGMGEQQSSGFSGMGGRMGSRQELDRDGMGQTPTGRGGSGGFGGFGSFSRDDMGSAEQPTTVRSPNTGGGGGFHRDPSSGGGGGFGAFSRDDMGQAPATPTTDGSRRGGRRGGGSGAGSKVASPNTRAPPGDDWRGADKKEQPEFPKEGDVEGGSSKPDRKAWRKGGDRQEGGSGPATPNSGGGGSWRDAPAKQQPATEGGGSWRGGEKKDQPPAKASAWRSGKSATPPPEAESKPAAADKKPVENSWRVGPPPASAWRGGDGDAAVKQQPSAGNTSSTSTSKAPMKVTGVEKRPPSKQ